MRDTLNLNEGLSIEISSKATPPKYPCPKCHGESKSTGSKGWRTCCEEKIYIGLTELEHQELLEEVAGLKARVIQMTEMYKSTNNEYVRVSRLLADRGISS